MSTTRTRTTCVVPLGPSPRSRAPTGGASTTRVNATTRHRIAIRIRRAPLDRDTRARDGPSYGRVVESGHRLAYGPCVRNVVAPSSHRGGDQIQVDHREDVEQAEDTSDRTWYGIDGPRRRPRPPVTSPPPPSAPVGPPPVQDAEPVVALPEVAPPASADPARPTVRERWREESEERSRDQGTERATRPERPEADAAPQLRDLEERFDRLRVAMSTELGRRIDAALARMEGTFEREIEALRTANREEAKRFRSSNGEAFVRIRAADTQELERIRRAIDEGIERLCSVLEGQLDRVWSANDVELERIRSAGADRLAEVHDLLTDQLERLRMEPPPQAPPPPEPAPAPRPRWWRRARSGASG